MKRGRFLIEDTLLAQGPFRKALFSAVTHVWTKQLPGGVSECCADGPFEDVEGDIPLYLLEATDMNDVRTFKWKRSG